MIDDDEQGGVVAGAPRRGAALAFALLLGGLLATACSSPLPEADSPGARLYVRECGICHPAYAPHLLRPAMWEMQIGRMAQLRRQRGLPPLSTRDEKVILEYLTRHAG